MSSTPRAATALRTKGFTGKGVTVGIVDSGCDGTHPDLTGRIEHNVTLVSAEYANQAPDESNTLVVPAAVPGYANSDIGSGHGTHVAGIVAADGTSGKDFLGVAPDAKLACFGIGAVITTTAVVTAYDYMLRQPKLLGIDVINNSWGNTFRQYDPKDPVNVATRAVTDRGAVVVFSAGNSGYENGESTVSPFNQAPWVISVAASDLQRKRGAFSSNGLRFDNGRPTAIGKGGHTVFTGNRIGNTMPDVSGPGVDISSSCDSAGTVIGPCPTHGNTEASGTSMSAPHVAGAAAVLVGANPDLTPAQVQDALKATASPMTAEGERLDSWQVGYGHVNLDRAVDLVRGRGWKQDLRTATRAADRRLRHDDAWAVMRADLWQEDAPPLAIGGSYSAEHPVTVERGTDALKLTLVYPTPGTAANLASATATVLDEKGDNRRADRDQPRLQHRPGPHAGPRAPAGRLHRPGRGRLRGVRPGHDRLRLGQRSGDLPAGGAAAEALTVPPVVEVRGRPRPSLETPGGPQKSKPSNMSPMPSPIEPMPSPRPSPRPPSASKPPLKSMPMNIHSIGPKAPK